MTNRRLEHTDEGTILSEKITIGEIRRLNHEMQTRIDQLLAEAKPARQRSVLARARAVAKAAKAIGIDPQTIEIDGVKVSAGQPTPKDTAAAKLDKWLEKNAR
jgi:hypothetical protein